MESFLILKHFENEIFKLETMQETNLKVLTFKCPQGHLNVSLNPNFYFEFFIPCPRQ